jgi:hypothetical protein
MGNNMERINWRMRLSKAVDSMLKTNRKWHWNQQKLSPFVTQFSNGSNCHTHTWGVHPRNRKWVMIIWKKQWLIYVYTYIYS